MDIDKRVIYRTMASEVEGTEFRSGRKSTFVVTRAVVDSGERLADPWIMVVYGYRKEGTDLALGRLDARQIHFTSERGLPEELFGLFTELREFWAKRLT